MRIAELERTLKSEGYTCDICSSGAYMVLLFTPKPMLLGSLFLGILGITGGN